MYKEKDTMINTSITYYIEKEQVKNKMKHNLTFSTFLSAGSGFSTSFRSPQSGSSFSLPHLAYFLFFNIARKSIPLESMHIYKIIDSSRWQGS